MQGEIDANMRRMLHSAKENFFVFVPGMVIMDAMNDRGGLGVISGRLFVLGEHG
jgi:hypothetical protein